MVLTSASLVMAINSDGLHARFGGADACAAVFTPIPLIEQK